MIDNKHKHRFAYHFTCIENLKDIITNGLLSTNLKDSKGITHENIANTDIQNRRSTMKINCGPKGVVHDYVPFYFTKRSPMLLGVVKKKNVDQESIIYLAVPIKYIENESVIFTNASANTNTAPKFYDNPSNLDELNWEVIDNWVWNPKNESLRQQKMAELLIHNEIKIEKIAHIITWDEDKKREVDLLLKENDIDGIDVICDINSFKNHYFHNFDESGRVNITSGPKVLLKETMRCINYILQNKSSNTLYPSLEAALAAINVNFSCIKELKEIEGLETDNTLHREDVGAHSRRVANNVLNGKGFCNYSERNKNILTLAAFLHDIGKGPKSRWRDGIQKVDDTHPIKSLPMLKRILCEDIGGLTSKEIRQIVMLVVYDDLVGDIVGRGRSEEQMKNIIKCKTDIDMLISIARADMKALNIFWVISHDNSIEQLRLRMYNFLEGEL